MEVDHPLLRKKIELPSSPPIFVLPLNLSLQDLHAIEESLADSGATVTYDVKEAAVVIGQITQKKRAALELRNKGQGTVEYDGKEEETEEGSRSCFDIPADMVKVIRLKWLLDSLRAGSPRPLKDYTIYTGRKVALKDAAASFSTSSRPLPVTTSNILERARADITSSPRALGSPFGAPQAMRWKSGRATKPELQRAKDGKTRSRSTSGERKGKGKKGTEGLSLIRQTTSEQKAEEEMPPAPDWVKQNQKYACMRPAYLHCANEDFIEQLGKIRKIRELTLDDIGVRAYSTAIAAIAAYNHPLRSAKEVLRLPGCENKIANLFTEFHRTGTLEAADALDKDEELKTLALFNDIWGVGPRAARDFYHRRGWRDLDDIVEYGWQSLTRVQQIGVKYFDELLVPIPREEVEKIEEVIVWNAKKVRPDADKDGHGIESIVVGGYRRGKEGSGDVDIVLSHRDNKVVKNLAYDIVASLEEEGYVTHTLAMNLTNSEREQHPRPMKGAGESHNFDTLDKALIVWQDPHFEGKQPESSPELSEEDVTGGEEEEGDVERGDLEQLQGLALRPKRRRKSPSGEHQKRKRQKQGKPSVSNIKNPNPHRRVDIIISPWRTVGCAVLGWTGGKTFERDFRRFAKASKFWKFDSSGVRDRATGKLIDLEEGGETWRQRERKVFEGVGVPWRPPEARNSR
ncbi:hypothetical protein KEM55_004185 [Ascosphaera atra]|nr:hypothetical protein KEM55_004185 [Ascosphaera atra]